MKTWIAKKLIDRSIDDNRPVPEWVDRLIESNPLLRQYQVEQQSLVARLREDAPGWVVESSCAAPASISNAPDPVASKNRTSQVALAVAACALLAVAWFMNRPAEVPQPVVDAPPKPFKSEDVERFVDRGQRMADHVSLGVSDYAAFASYANPNELGRKTREYVREAGSVYGRGLAVLNRAAGEQAD